MYKTYTGWLTWQQIDSAADILIRNSLLDSSQALSLEKISSTRLLLTITKVQLEAWA